MKNKLLGYYNYTVVLTYVGMLVGFTGIISVMEGHFRSALFCLMIAGVCDMFDGAIAATRERSVQEKCFGIQIDSLSDLICFGVLPALLIYGINAGNRFALFFSCLYVLCALIRLAFFNVDEQERQQGTTEARKYYFGMPVTLSALILPVTFEVCSLLHKPARSAGIVVIAAMAVAFLLPVKLKKPKIIGKICMVLCGITELALLILAVGDV